MSNVKGALQLRERLESGDMFNSKLLIVSRRPVGYFVVALKIKVSLLISNMSYATTLLSLYTTRYTYCKRKLFQML